MPWEWSDSRAASEQMPSPRTRVEPRRDDPDHRRDGCPGTVPDKYSNHPGFAVWIYRPAKIEIRAYHWESNPMDSRRNLLPAPEHDGLLPVKLTQLDEDMLNGIHGKAAQVAMRVMIRTAEIQRVSELIDMEQAHIDCCIYTGPATLKFAQRLREWGTHIRIPTSLQAISIDRRLWRSQQVDPTIGEPAEQLAQTYEETGANVLWAESNAVVFANNILGARTIKCPGFLDVRCFPLVGYHAGDLAGDSIPIIMGLERHKVTIEDLKAFGAAFATTSSAPMFHIAGITIEARSVTDIEDHLSGTSRVTLTRPDLAKQWNCFNIHEQGEESTPLDLISLGNPHLLIRRNRKTSPSLRRPAQERYYSGGDMQPRHIQPSIPRRIYDESRRLRGSGYDRYVLVHDPGTGYSTGFADYHDGTRPSMLTTGGGGQSSRCGLGDLRNVWILRVRVGCGIVFLFGLTVVHTT
ncbi:Aconitase/3-isopropylmalate dehydratase, partial [Penicillium alfredii]